VLTTTTPTDTGQPDPSLDEGQAGPCPDPEAGALHARFLELLLWVERIARRRFRHVRCADTRDDLVAEAVALAWRRFLHLAARGKDPADFPAAFAARAAQAVANGRGACGQQPGRDALSPLARKRHGFTVARLPLATARPPDGLLGTARGRPDLDAFEEWLRDNTVTPVLEQVCFRVDFSSWLTTLTARERQLVRAMARSERTLDLSAWFEVSPGRISQLRRELRDGWRRFCGEATAKSATAS
jgi:hypothetical protein